MQCCSMTYVNLYSCIEQAVCLQSAIAEKYEVHGKGIVLVSNCCCMAKAAARLHEHIKLLSSANMCSAVNAVEYTRALNSFERSSFTRVDE
jgi:hypothetical protein